jgi:hypothetical protein
VISSRVVFLVGAPRSGTTWLQHLLGAHPRIATPQETDLLDRYVASWLRSWRAQLEASAGPERRVRGLPAVLTEEQFRGVLRHVVERVYGSVLELKPGADIVLDKNPYHAYHLRGALILLPDAAVVHLVRDGRDVACSLMRASARAWGEGWAPSRLDGAAEQWRELVTVAGSARELTDRYAEVRYEALHSADAPPLLTSLYELCGLEPDEDLARRTPEQFDLARLRTLPAAEQPCGIVWGGELVADGATRPAEPKGFVGGGTPGAWREQFSACDRWLVDRVAGDLLLDLGYELDRSWVGVGIAGRARARGRHMAARASHRLRRLLPG